MFKKKGKKAMSISIVLLVILTAMLLGVTLFFFSQGRLQEKRTLSTTDLVDSVYSDEAILNFYLQNAFDDATNNLTFEDGKTKFIDNFRKELKKYDDAGKDFTPIISYISDDLENKPIDFNENKVIITLNITLTRKENLAIGLPLISYNYEKKLEKYFG